MSRPLLHLVLLAVSVAACVSAALGYDGPMVGRWRHIEDVSGEGIQELGRWAVAEHAKLASDGLQFRRVTGGEEQVVSGTNYRLFVDATDTAGRNAAYEALVYEQLWTNTRRLKYFKAVTN